MPGVPYHFDVVTLFEPLMTGYLAGSILGRAHKAGIVSVGFTNPRDYTDDVHRSVDDTPYGGGAGMVMMAEPLARAVEAVKEARPRSRVVLLSPAGKPFDQATATRYAALGQLTLVCGRYEGIDERFIDALVDESLSLGDFVITGGEIAALAVIDAVTRLLPGTLGHRQGAAVESFTDAPLLEYPHYTRPRDWRGHLVPDVLTSGHHAAIDQWRLAQRVARTRARRPDLFATYVGRQGREGTEDCG